MRATSYAGDSQRLAQISYPNQTSTQYGYFPASGDLRLKTLNHYSNGTSLLSSHTYSYDAEGQILNWQRSGTESANETFSYDAAGQLKQVTGSKAFGYDYDAVGNRIQETIGAQATTAVFNNLNQLQTNGGGSYGHDLEGNQNQRTSATLGNRGYQWDAENRLIALDDPNNTLTRSDFSYDAIGRRIGIKDQSNGTITKDARLVYCGTRLCAEKDNVSGSFSRYYGDGAAKDGVASFYYRDHLGSVRLVSNAGGAAKASYAYDPYGRRTVLTGSAADSPFGYTGHYVHQASGLALAPYRAYDAEIGRWISRDPIGERGGLNLYGYVGNSPLIRVDPLGFAQSQPYYAPGPFWLPGTPANQAWGDAFYKSCKTIGDAVSDAINRMFNNASDNEQCDEECPKEKAPRKRGDRMTDGDSSLDQLNGATEAQDRSKANRPSIVDEDDEWEGARNRPKANDVYGLGKSGQRARYKKYE